MLEDIKGNLFTVEEAAACGVSRAQLSRMVGEGTVERLARGVYARPGKVCHPMMASAILAKSGTDFVVALESALRMHDFTTAMPHALWIKLPRGARKPAADFPIETIFVKADDFGVGVEVKEIEGVPVKVTGAAKTVVDLFRFRGRVGLDIALEAMKEGLREGLFTADKLIACARGVKMANVIRPYVEGYFG